MFFGANANGILLEKKLSSDSKSPYRKTDTGSNCASGFKTLVFVTAGIYFTSTALPSMM